MGKNIKDIERDLQALKRPDVTLDDDHKNHIENLINEKIHAHNRRDVTPKGMYVKIGFAIAAVLIGIVGYTFFTGFPGKSGINVKHSAILTAMSGTITVYEQDETPETLSTLPEKLVGLDEGARIVTMHDSSCSIRINETSICEVMENSEIYLNTITKHENNETNIIDLKKGFVDCDVNLSSSSSVFTVRHERGDVTVHGTRFSFGLNPENTLVVSVVDGEVALENFIPVPENLERIKDTNPTEFEAINELVNKKIIVTPKKDIKIAKKDIDIIEEKTNVITQIILNNKNASGALSNLSAMVSSVSKGEGISDELLVEITPTPQEVKPTTTEVVTAKERYIEFTGKMVSIETSNGNRFVGRVDNVEAGYVYLKGSLGNLKIDSKQIKLIRIEE